MTAKFVSVPLDGHRALLAERDRLKAERAELAKALTTLATCEAAYRELYETEGDSAIHTGHAWDHMRHAGDQARAILAKCAKETA